MQDQRLKQIEEIHHAARDLVSIKMSEVYDFLNDEPRYRELIKKIGLPE